MRRLLPFLTVLGLVSTFGASTGAPAAARPRTAAPVSLTAFACRRALDPPNRSVSVTAVMRPVAGTRALELRFDLLEKAGGTTTRLAGAGDLGVWLSPRDPTLGRRPGDRWVLTKSVSNLDAPAGYRFRVAFRWIGAHGKVLATAIRQSPRCAQPELRPDVLVRSVVVTAIAHRPHKQLYTVVIANRGASSAGPFAVLFTPGGGGASQTHTVTRLDAHSARQLSFVGPTCDPASPPTVVADSADQVDDRARDNNAMTVTCPS